MIEFLVGAACYLTLFAVLPGSGPAMQVLALVLLFGAAAWAVFLDRVKAIPTSAPELVMYVVGVAYIAVAMLTDENSVGISIAFLCTIIFISIVSRAISLERVMDVGATVALLCVLTAIVVDHQEALAALVPSGGGAGLNRFMPLHSTPNLVGYIYGAGSILMVRRALVSKKTIERIVMAGGALFSCLFVLAASARSSLIALVAAASVAIILEYRARRFFSLKWVKLGAITFIILGLAFSERIGAYFTRMLELDSDTRGLATGGTGRTGLWARGIATLVDDPMRFMFGAGFRSSSPDVIGFPTESSYITILLDSGVFIGAAVILVFAYSPIKALKLTSPQSRHASSLVLVASFLTFLIVESIFNRYLLAIGNPTSLLSLLVLFTVSIRQGTATAVDQAPREQKAVDDKLGPIHR
jgi:exopolysaccharide production protein ExoQ